MRRLALLVLAVLPAALLLLVPASRGADTSALQRQIDAKQQREARLGSQAARLGRIERRVAEQVALLQGRLDRVQQELSQSQAELDQTRVDLRSERSRALRLRGKLSRGKEMLATMLIDHYESSPPDLISVVLQSRGFADLLESAAFIKRIQSRNTEIVDVVRSARVDAKTQARRLARLEKRRTSETRAVLARRNAVASMTQAVEQRRAAIAQARAARLALKRATRASRLRASKTLDKILAEQRKALYGPGPGGPWAIPWPIVQCESGGQNVPPNYLGASGYYQFMPATWRGLGGSTPNAYQASKSEQDRLAARLWAGGKGARNWDCAAIVGLL